MKDGTDLNTADHQLRQFLANVTGAKSLADPGRLNVSDRVYALSNASIVQNCSFWGGLGVVCVGDPSELKARQQNATGDSSMVGWLAVEVRPNRDDIYVLVGAVSIWTEARYEK